MLVRNKRQNTINRTNLDLSRLCFQNSEKIDSTVKEHSIEIYKNIKILTHLCLDKDLKPLIDAVTNAMDEFNCTCNKLGEIKFNLLNLLEENACLQNELKQQKKQLDMTNSKVFELEDAFEDERREQTFKQVKTESSIKNTRMGKKLLMNKNTQTNKRDISLNVSVNKSIDIPSSHSYNDKIPQSTEKQIVNNIQCETSSSKLKRKKKIILLADSHGRGLQKGLQNNFGDEYEVTVIFKPNCRLIHLTRDLSTLSARLSKDDYVLIFGGGNDVDNSRPYQLSIHQAINHMKNASSKTNIIFLEALNRYDQPWKNDEISFLNNICFNKLTAIKSIINTNRELSRFHYTRHGLHLNRKGKYKLIEIISKHLKPNRGERSFDTNERKLSSNKSKSLAEELIEIQHHVTNCSIISEDSFSSCYNNSRNGGTYVHSSATKNGSKSLNYNQHWLDLNGHNRNSSVSELVSSIHSNGQSFRKTSTPNHAKEKKIASSITLQTVNDTRAEATTCISPNTVSWKAENYLGSPSHFLEQ